MPPRSSRRAREAIARQEAVGALSDRAWMLYQEALGHLAAGEPDEADAAVSRALEVAEGHGEEGAMAWAHYVGALIAQRQGHAAAAERHLEQAEEIAETLGLAVLLERCRAAQHSSPS